MKRINVKVTTPSGEQYRLTAPQLAALHRAYDPTSIRRRTRSISTATMNRLWDLGLIKFNRQVSGGFGLTEAGLDALRAALQQGYNNMKWEA
jgi:hypothetical protein